MKRLSNYKSILFFLFLFGLTPSCNGQKKAELPKEHISQTKQSSIDLSDHDPYFKETETISSPYGPTSITRNIIQDKNGNIWLATWEGILRYDGKTFTNFTNKMGLRRFHAFAVLEDSKSNLWFGTIGAGVYRYDGKAFTNFTTKDGLPNDRVTYIYEDKSGNIWFGTEGGASCYNGTNFRNFTTNEGLLYNDVNSIIEDKNGTFWFGTRGYTSVYDGKTFTEFTTKDGTSFGNVRSIIEDSNGVIWLGGKNGLWSYDPDKGGAFTNFTTNFVGYIYEDRKGNIWTSSEGYYSGNWALSRYDKLYIPNLETKATEIKAELGMFFGILEDDEGGIWLGTLEGVCRYDGTSFNYFRDK